ncbi:MAG: glycosyltransferase family 2 protein [Syntrophales bacterium]
MTLSVILPVNNEERNLPELLPRLTQTLAQLTDRYEIIFIDDGSRDGSLNLIKQFASLDRRIKSLALSRNFGQMAALSAGLDLASGQAVIMMDADLQHPPELIPQLVANWRAGAEIVNTIRRDNAKTGLFKKLTARFFYWLMGRTTGLELRVGMADFRLLDRRVVESLKGLKERARFLRGLVSWVGFHQEFVGYQADQRFAGQSKYTFRRMAAFALDGITSFSALPLRLATYLGLLVASASFFYLLYTIYIRFFTSRAIEGWASVMGTLLFLGGIQLIFLGVIGEYLSRIYDESKQRPLYIIREKINL